MNLEGRNQKDIVFETRKTIKEKMCNRVITSVLRKGQDKHKV